MAIKKISICTGFDANDTPIWSTEEIGVKASNVVLTTNILGVNNLQTALSALPSVAFPIEDRGNILYLDGNGQIQVSDIPISWLMEKYEEEQGEEPITPEPEPQEPEENELEEPNLNQ